MPSGSNLELDELKAIMVEFEFCTPGPSSSRYDTNGTRIFEDMDLKSVTGDPTVS